ncbi:hypothetical protein ElyMa_000451500 [Elysia marginata]|uniref:Uncharacterized protein n=1 Tax=Elysia marginata TaxID=1093978 RepID=A0AAV4FPE8_9GAST|nr:hypothetical protein ElyMa_000451500 [Elysia marginata]
MNVEEHDPGDSSMLTGVQRSCRLRCMALLFSMVAGAVLATVFLWTLGDRSASLRWEHPLRLFKASSRPPPDTGYYTCTSTPGILKRDVLANLSSYQLRPSHQHLDLMKKILINRLTDDYCYCKRTVQSYVSTCS